MASPIPQAKTSDSEDVSWALQTAESQWARGDREEALKWLRRAVESASEGEDDMRALELAKAAAELTAPPPPSVPAPPVSRPPPPSRPGPSVAPQPPRSGPSVAPPAPRSGTSVAPPRPSGAPPRPSGAPPAPRSGPSVAPQRPTAPRVAPNATPRPVAAKTVPGPKDPKKEEQRKSARKSHAGEVQRGRGAPDEATHTHDMVFTATQQVDAAATQQLEAAPGPTVTEGHAHRDAMATAPPEVPPDAGGADAWPTEAIKGADMPSFEHERTRIGAAAYAPPADERPSSGPRPSQAVRIVLYRAADGSLRLAPAGSDVSAVTVEAMLVAMDPEVDLRAWLASK